MRQPSRLAPTLLLALASLLSACAGPAVRPWTYVDQREMEGRPGLFSGPNGDFVLYRQ